MGEQDIVRPRMTGPIDEQERDPSRIVLRVRVGAGADQGDDGVGVASVGRPVQGAPSVGPILRVRVGAGTKQGEDALDAASVDRPVQGAPSVGLILRVRVGAGTKQGEDSRKVVLFRSVMQGGGGREGSHGECEGHGGKGLHHDGFTHCSMPIADSINSISPPIPLA